MKIIQSGGERVNARKESAGLVERSLPSAGVKPQDVWQEMERREILLGIAEKMPKSAVKMAKEAQRIARRPVVALDGRRMRKRH